jgi:hypothetical protein
MPAGDSDVVILCALQFCRLTGMGIRSCAPALLKKIGRNGQSLTSIPAAFTRLVKNGAYNHSLSVLSALAASSRVPRGPCDWYERGVTQRLRKGRGVEPFC